MSDRKRTIIKETHGEEKKRKYDSDNPTRIKLEDDIIQIIAYNQHGVLIYFIPGKELKKTERQLLEENHTNQASTECMELLQRLDDYAKPLNEMSAVRVGNKFTCYWMIYRLDNNQSNNSEYI